MIIGPFPDGGYELWCSGCGVKLTCFSIVEMLCDDNPKRMFTYYERFRCKDCKDDTVYNEDLTEKELEIFNDLFDENW